MDNSTLCDGYNTGQEEPSSIEPNRKRKASRKKRVWLVVFCVALMLVTAIVWMCLSSSAPRYLNDFEQILSVSDGMAIVVPNSRWLSVVDIETGRVLISFQNHGNTAVRAHFPHEAGTIIVERVQSRRVRNQETGQWERRGFLEWGLIEIETGRELIPFGEYNMLHTAFDGMAVVVDRDDWSIRGLIEIESGREILSFQYVDISAVSSDLVSARIRAGTIAEDRHYLFQITEGREAILLGRYDHIGSYHNGAVLVQYGDNWYLLDVESGRQETVLPGRYDMVSISYRADGLAVVRRDGEMAVVELESGRELIHFGQYEQLILLSNNRAIVWPAWNWITGAGIGWGLIDFVTGETLIPVGQYGQRFPCRNSPLSVEGLIVAYGEAVGLIDESENEIIPFGRYDEIRRFRDGTIAVSQGGRWWFYYNE